VNFFFENLSLVPETSAAMEHFKLVFGSGNSSPAKIRPLKNWPPPFPGSHRLLGTSIATRGTPFPLRGCPRARALEWESSISLRWLFGDSNAVVSSRWGLGGLRHFRGALRPFRHSSRGFPTGSAPPRCGYWGSLGFFCSAPQDFGMLGLTVRKHA